MNVTTDDNREIVGNVDILNSNHCKVIGDVNICTDHYNTIVYGNCNIITGNVNADHGTNNTYQRVIVAITQIGLIIFPICRIGLIIPLISQIILIMFPIAQIILIMFPICRICLIIFPICRIGLVILLMAHLAER